MKRKLNIISTATAASFLTMTSLAQVNSPVKTDRPDYTYPRATHPRSDRMNGAAKASDIIGMTVKNYQDEKLGKVEDLAVDVESGRIVQVILSTGGFIGVGDRLTAVPPGALHHDVVNKVLHLDANKEKLKNAPEFTSAKWTQCCDNEQLASTYSYYGHEAAYKFVGKGDAHEGDDVITPTRNADGTWNKNRRTGESQWMIPIARLHQTQRASKLMGLAVKNQQDEKLGKVENLMVDVQSGRVIALVISSGGFLGMGDELSAVPPTALRFNTERDTLQLDTTKEFLSAAPHFKSTQWPEFGQADYSHGVYRAYNVEPYFRTDAATDADDTERNARKRADQPLGTQKPDNTGRDVPDRGSRTLTPFDQGNNKADTDTTAQIRKGIIADKSMSVNARNVKVITNQGQVTLRGPVNTPEEKQLIGDIAIRIARSENVDNQLEVK